MNRILNCVASDFGKETTTYELKDAIKASEGRTILVEIAAFEAPMYDSVTNGEIAAAFGADLLLIKHMDYRVCKIEGANAENPISLIRKLTGNGVGLNLEITDDTTHGMEVSEEHIRKAISLKPDFLSITGYKRPEVNSNRILSEIKAVRDQYDGFLMVHHVMGNIVDLDVDNYLSYVEAGADMITLPAPGAIPGVTEYNLASIIKAIREAGAIVSLTTSTSQEGTDTETSRDIAIASKRAGTDVYAFGDAGISGMAEPNNIMTTSIAIRGKRHTYVRMARSANR